MRASRHSRRCPVAPSPRPRALVSAPRSPASQSIGDDHEFFLSKFKDRIDRYAGVSRGDALPAETIIERPIRLASLVVGDDGGDNTSVSNLGNHARYYRLPTTHDARLFYFFFESRRHKKEDPVVIWLTGGPGCSSELALFYDNGPFYIADNMSLLWNEFGWDQESNLIYVDRPTGTGFSYSSDSHDTRHNEAGVINDLYDFLQYYDMRKPCVGSLCYDFSNLEKFFNLKSIRQSLGVGDIEFVSCSPTVYQTIRL
ncbi:hypothetical protein ZWY2020_037261 [Hordeum vulgare]|nr:hypothetical protein ZWY2020_037261 [Hordeum vulgare]